MDTYHWDILVTYHCDVVGFFIWDLLVTSWRRTNGTSSLRPHEMSSRHTNKKSWRRTTEKSLGVSFEMYTLLGGAYRETSLPNGPLKMMKNAFYFTLEARFVRKIFKCLYWLFGHVAKGLDSKNEVNFEMYGVKTWSTNNYNIHIAQYLKNWMQPGNENWSVNRTYHEKHFYRKIIHKIRWRNCFQTLF